MIASATARPMSSRSAPLATAPATAPANDDGPVFLKWDSADIEYTVPGKDGTRIVRSMSVDVGEPDMYLTEQAFRGKTPVSKQYGTVWSLEPTDANLARVNKIFDAVDSLDNMKPSHSGTFNLPRMSDAALANRNMAQIERSSETFMELENFQRGMNNLTAPMSDVIDGAKSLEGYFREHGTAEPFGS